MEAYKTLEKCFSQEHRGPLAHAHFMRTFCQRIPGPQTQAPDNEDRPLVSLSEEPSDASTKPSLAESVSTPKKTAGKEESSGTPKSEVKKKGKAEQIAERHPKRPKRNNGPPGNPPHSKDRPSIRLTNQLSSEVSKLGSSNGKMVLFVSLPRWPTVTSPFRIANLEVDAFPPLRDGRAASEADKFYTKRAERARSAG